MHPIRGRPADVEERGHLNRIRDIGRHDQAASRMRARALRRKHDIGALVLTRSEEGMSLFDDAGHIQVPAQAREVFDVTTASKEIIPLVGFYLQPAVGGRVRVVRQFVTESLVLALIGGDGIDLPCPQSRRGGARRVAGEIFAG